MKNPKLRTNKPSILFSMVNICIRCGQVCFQSFHKKIINHPSIVEDTILLIFLEWTTCNDTKTGIQFNNRLIINSRSTGKCKKITAFNILLLIVF